MAGGRLLDFAASLAPRADAYEQALDLAQTANGLGLKFLGIQDHPYIGHFFDARTLIAPVAARTEHIRLLPDVATDATTSV